MQDESTANKEDCFGVAMFTNGQPLDFEECSGDNFTLHGCKYPEFLALMDKFWYDGPDADDLNAACKATPPSLQ